MEKKAKPELRRKDKAQIIIMNWIKGTHGTTKLLSLTPMKQACARWIRNT